MWPRDGTVLTVSSRALLAACERLGIDAEALLRAVGIPRQRLEDPDARLQNAEAGALWAKAYELSGDPVLSLRAAEVCPIGAYKVIDYMAASARTVGEAFQYAARYFPLVNTAVRLSIDASGDPVAFDVAGASGPAGVTRPYAEYCLAVFVLHVRGATGVPFPVRRVTFSHPRPPDVREHERVFGCAVEFDSERNRLDLDREATVRLYLDQPDIALAGIAYLLGFADQSAFNRAFKRWTGRTPGESRALALRARAASPRA